MNGDRELRLLLPDGLVDEIVERVAERLPAAAVGESWRLRTLDEASAMLTRSPRWLRQKAKVGDIAHVRLDGGALAFDPDDLREFARARRVGG